MPAFSLSSSLHPLLLDSPLYSQPLPPFFFPVIILVLFLLYKYRRFSLQCCLPPILFKFPPFRVFPRQWTQGSLATSPSPFVMTLIPPCKRLRLLLISRYFRGQSSYPLAYHLFFSTEYTEYSRSSYFLLYKRHVKHVQWCRRRDSKLFKRQGNSTSTILWPKNCGTPLIYLLDFVDWRRFILQDAVLRMLSSIRSFGRRIIRQ